MHLPINPYTPIKMKTGQSSSRPHIALYLALLLLHFAHVLEEIYGRFWIMDKIFGPRWFMIVNWLLYCIPVVIFYFILLNRKWAFRLGIVYAVIMIVNGMIHNIAFLITGRYYSGFAGNITGLAFIFIGPVLIYHLRKIIIMDSGSSPPKAGQPGMTAQN